MFGYFRPYDADLTARQLKTFRSYYCRLCCGLRSMGGQRARYLTTFDATIYYMIYNMAVGLPTPPYFRCEKLSKVGMRMTENDELAMKFVRCVLVAIGEKMRDDRLDGDKFKSRFIKVMFGKAIKSAQTAEPELARVTFEGTELINRMQERGATAEELFDSYGDVLAKSLLCVGEVDERYVELYAAIAAWTFYVDVLCDYDEDFAGNKFNPLRQGDKPTLAALFDTEYTALLALNDRVCARVVNALSAVKNNTLEWHTIRNILVHGMTTVVPNLLEGKNVKFRYFKELIKNNKILKRNRKRFEEAERIEAKRKKSLQNTAPTADGN